MSSTNNTTNYDLSQFIGSDKPAWLVDYNQDMTKIDTRMKANADLATSADGKADANTTKIGDLDYLSTTVKTSLVGAVNEVDGKAETAQNTANLANTTANSAKNVADDLADKFNLNTFTDYTASDVTSIGSNVASIGIANYHLAKNDDGSLCKIYGSIDLSGTTNTGSLKLQLIADSGLRPTSDINITGTNIKFEYVTINGVTATGEIRTGTITIKTNGAVEYTVNVVNRQAYAPIRFFACLIFVKDFGDEPEE